MPKLCWLGLTSPEKGSGVGFPMAPRKALLGELIWPGPNVKVCPPVGVAGIGPGETGGGIDRVKGHEDNRQCRRAECRGKCALTRRQCLPLGGPVMT